QEFENNWVRRNAPIRLAPTALRRREHLPVPSRSARIAFRRAPRDRLPQPLPRLGAAALLLKFPLAFRFADQPAHPRFSPPAGLAAANQMSEHGRRGNPGPAEANAPASAP